jgi:hypothetical protein
MRLVPWIAIGLSAPALGCTGAVSAPAGPGDAERSTTTSAFVLVERSVGSTASPRAETSARFVRIPAGASTRDALRTIGAAVELPARGSCATAASLAEATAPAEAAPVVELLDVGAVALEANGRETRLMPRQLPDVTDVVSGVVYARAADPALVPPATKYVVHVGGGLDVEPFDVSATAPADPADVHLAGEDATSGLSLAPGAPVDLAWTAEAMDDVLYVDVQPSGYRCTLEDGTAAGDHGRASIPAALVDDAGTVVVHRVHRESQPVRGLESTEIRFDFSRSVAYARR